MENPTSRMVALLAAMRRERNGAVADGMRWYGADYGLNYGVSLPTVRAIARACEPDHAFARMLYRQEVRELRLAALHLASPSSLTIDELPAWAAGIINSEVAGEAAFALLGRAPVLPLIFERSRESDEPLLVYAALMAAARWSGPPAEWAFRAVGAVRRMGGEVAAGRLAAWAERLAVQGATALLAAIGEHDAANRQAVFRAADSLGDAPAAVTLREELAWRWEP